MTKYEQQRQERALFTLSSLLALGVGFKVEQGRLLALGGNVSPCTQALVDKYSDVMIEYVPAAGIAPADGIHRPAPAISADDRMRLIHRGTTAAKRRQHINQDAWTYQQRKRKAKTYRVLL